MKRLLSVIICMFMLIGLFSCGRKNGADKKTPDGEGTKKAEQTTEKYVSSVYEGVVDIPNDGVIDEASLVLYDDVISLYRDVINICQNYVDSKDATERYASELGITDKKEKELFSELLNYAYLQYPGRGKEDYLSPHYKLSCGYALKDLNGDGVAELVLLNNDYTVIAIFSVVDGKPVLLDSYFPGRGCWIDKNGYVHVGGSNGADSGSKGIYKIAEGGGSLDLLFEFGTDGNEWVNDVALIKYYKIENGEKKYITEEEYNSISDQYDRYLGNRLSKEVTKEDSGLKFTSLFSETDIADENNKISTIDTIYINSKTGKIIVYDPPVGAK